MRRLVVLAVLMAYTLLIFEQARAQAQLAAPLVNNAFRRVISSSIAQNLAARTASSCTGPCLQTAQIRTMARIDKAANDAVFASSAVMTVAAIAGAPVWFTVLVGAGALAAVGSVAWGVYKLTQTDELTLILEKDSTPLMTKPQNIESPSIFAGRHVYGNIQTIPDGDVYNFTGKFFGPSSCWMKSEEACSNQPAEITSAPWVSVVPAIPPSYHRFDVVGNSVDDALRNAAIGAAWADLTTLPENHQSTDFRFTLNERPQCAVKPHNGHCGQWRVSIAVDYKTFRELTSYGERGSKPIKTQEWIRHDISFSTHIRQGSGYKSLRHEGGLNNIVGHLSPELKAEPLPDHLIAEVANRLWQRAAASEGYDGEPYEASLPVTAATVRAALDAEPSIKPTWADLLDPIHDPDPNKNNNPAANTTAPRPRHREDPNASQDASSKEVLIPPPELEPYSAEQILEPLLGIYRQFKEFAVPSHVAECPRPKVELFGKSLLMEEHCKLAENHRSEIRSIMLVCWAIAALLIVLRA